ncbi:MULTISPECIES: bacterio-opsin activator domain-containing protein [Haloferacaceae]|uniref:Bacterio-opsin activator domain-containing protein n=1 Tax=Halorubrum glutamatedens TaxID=2707018 RepID=A0ABD5QRI6_9EURY|nr:bacterio-opsin activator domain-containing protein [Halobellus captivus]
MADPIPSEAYDALVTAAETHRAAIVVRLAGEAGLRTAEVTRVRPRDRRESESVPGTFLLAVPAAEGSGGTAGDDEPGSDPHDGRIDRETVIPASLSAALRRYAESEGLDPGEPFVDVSARRVQMLVRETAERAGERRNDPSLASVTPRDLRRVFARRLLVDRGVDPHVVREAGGWRTMDALDPHLDPLDGEAIAAAVAGGDRVSGADRIDGSARIDGDEGSRADRSGFSGESPLLAAFETIVDAPGGEASFEAVVERVTDGERWRGACVVRGRSTGGRSDDFLAAAGDVESSSVPAAVTVPAETDGSDPPWNATIADREGTTADAVEPVVDEEGDTEGDEAAWIAAPIAYRGTAYGTLCLLAAGAPVTPAERRTVGALGRCLGWAVAAGRWRELLHSDAVTEVEFRTSSSAAFLASTSATLDCRIELESTVAVSEAASRWYLHVTRAGTRAVADAVEGTTGASEIRVIETREDGCSVSVRVTGGSFVRALTERGAAVDDAIATEGELRVVADLPDGTDVRRIADGLRESFPDARLVSKESVARSPRTESALREGVADRLTDRQWATLSAAYHSGYFDWPRRSTAEEVADAMDVSSPTFHNHLRKAERALLETLFEERDVRDRA